MNPHAGIPSIKPATGDMFSSRKHVLDLDDFTADEIQLVLDNTVAMQEVISRSVRKVPALRGRSIVTLFHEPSTRTRVSFEQAGKILSADVINISDSASSAKKGESLYNTALTIQAMQADIIVVRHPHSGSPNFLARHLSSSIINAGDGSHAHPSQALLDLYTIQSHFGDIKNRKVVIVGDILYSRVARSNLWGLTKMGAKVVLCSPPTLIPPDFIKGFPKNHPFASVSITHNLSEAVEGADVIMALRLQAERQGRGRLPSLREYSNLYGINAKTLKLANKDVLIMHPGPMNEGVEIDTEIAHGPHSVIQEQVTNGVAVRMALLYAVASANGGNK
jgi:aspartate carbamoyltransferase catalytic subunit|tara:strand:+ start:11870 stop:12874 length:1005 start_codon:yes stop_codon:yes gene_type:complete